MSEVKLRLAIRDLYRGDGGPLNDYNQGWNDGVDAAAEILYPLVERAEGGEMTEAEKLALDLLAEPNEYDLAEAAALLRSQQAKIKRMAEALRKLACLGNGDKPGNSIGNDIAIDALRDAGVKP